MSIKVGDKDLFPYLGDYRPVNIYKGEHKVAGWKWVEQSGVELHFENTYNDSVHVELDGKSYQGGKPSPDYPIVIHSLNDFDVVSSVGKRNLVLNSKRDISATHLGIFDRNYRPLLGGKTYTLSFDVKTSTNTMSNVIFLNGSITIYKHIPINTEYQRHSVTFKYIEHDYGGRQIYPHIYPSDSTGLSWTNFKIEEGENATPYSPAPEDITENDNHPLIDKINLLLDEPLRSADDVKDRLFKDSDGLWKIERNVEPIHPEDGTRTIEETHGVLDSPIYKVLPQELQDKLNNLRSFQESNYVYTIINNKTDIISENSKPTLHARLKVKDI